MVWGNVGCSLAQLGRKHYLASKEPLIDLALPRQFSWLCSKLSYL